MTRFLYNYIKPSGASATLTIYDDNGRWYIQNFNNGNVITYQSDFTSLQETIDYLNTHDSNDTLHLTFNSHFGANQPGSRYSIRRIHSISTHEYEIVYDNQNSNYLIRQTKPVGHEEEYPNRFNTLDSAIAYINRGWGITQAFGKNKNVKNDKDIKYLGKKCKR